MRLSYTYQGHEYSLKVNWTQDSRSAIFNEIQRKIEKDHGIDLSDYNALTEHLDSLTDLLYKRMYSLPEHHSNTYNPAYPQMLESIVSEINTGIHALPRIEYSGILFSLYCDVLNKLREVTDVFKADNRYQDKVRKHLERSTETTWEERLATDFEDTLLDTIDLTGILNMLTETQKGRLIQYYYHCSTLQEIADLENATFQSVHESIKTAIKKAEAFIFNCK